MGFFGQIGAQTICIIVNHKTHSVTGVGPGLRPSPLVHIKLSCGDPKVGERGPEPPGK